MEKLVSGNDRGTVNVTAGHKYCGSCKESVPRANFYLRRGSKDGLQIWCKACHTQRRDAAYATKMGRPVRKHGRKHTGYIDGEGYMSICLGNERIKMHRLLMQRSLGRRLEAHENVHHKNGDRLDNRLVQGHELKCPSTCCNLELWSHRQPSGQRVADKLTWARELVTPYAPAEDDETDTDVDAFIATVMAASHEPLSARSRPSAAASAVAR